MKTCNCANHDSTDCRAGHLERPRYFPRQLITPAEMNLEQDYFRRRLRLHNRMMHGWGVVCGSLVCASAEPWRVIVKPGYILGPYGDEIYIDGDHAVDLRTAGGSHGAAGEASASTDPWCSEVYVPREPDAPLYVAVKYEERMTQPVRTHPSSCGCDESSCEYSRWCDGYAIGILDRWDCSPQPPSPAELFIGPNPPCPPCPESPWVVLAKVEVDPAGKVLSIDNCSCRRIVASFGDFWWRCREQNVGDQAWSWREVAIIDPDGSRLEDRLVERGRDFFIEIAGAGFKEGMEAHFADQKAAKIREVALASPELIKISATVHEQAPAGRHDLVLLHPEGEKVISGALRVADLGTQEPPPKPNKPRTTRRRTKKPAAGGTTKGT